MEPDDIYDWDELPDITFCYKTIGGAKVSKIVNTGSKGDWEYQSSPDDIYQHKDNQLLYNKVWHNNTTALLPIGKVWAVPCKGQGCDETPRQLFEPSLSLYYPEDHIIEVGDTVVLKSGETYQTVEEVSGDYITTSYSGKIHGSNTNRHKDDYRLIKKSNTNKWNEEMTNTPKLYEITQGETKSYGYKLAVNSSGQWVMEIKGSGDTLAVDKSQVEEVMPHTVSIRFNKESVGNDYHFFADKGSVEVGKFYLNENFDVFTVTGVDTKSKTATLDLKVVGQIEVIEV